MSTLEYFRGGGKISLVFWNSCSCWCWRSTQQSCKFSGFKDIFIRQNILIFTNFLILISMSWIMLTITNYYSSNIQYSSRVAFWCVWVLTPVVWSSLWRATAKRLDNTGSHDLNLKVKSYSKEVGQYRFLLFCNHQVERAGKCIHYGLLQHNLIT